MKRNLLRLFAFAASCALLLSAQAQTTPGKTLFGVTFFGNQLIAINPATGSAYTVGSFGETVSPYGIAAYGGNLYTFDPNTNRILQINPASGKVAQSIDVGLSGLQGEGDLAIRASDGMGFLVSALSASGVPTNDFYTFNLTTKTAVRLGSTGTAIDGLAFKSDGTLYGLGQGDASLYTINTLTGAATKVGDLGLTPGSPIAGLAFAANPQAANPGNDETLYAAVDDRLYTIDITTGAATPVSMDVLDLGYSSVSGLVSATGAGAVANMAARVPVGTGERVGIGGFIVRGGSKKVVLRGIGPSITGLSGVLADPKIQLFNSQNQSIAQNDNWMDNANAQDLTNLGLAPGNAKEAALLTTLDPGSYSVILSGANNSTGIGLVEIYDAEVGVGGMVANISSRGYVDSGDNIVIGGIIVGGSASQRIATRAIGPDLANAGVTGPLADPFLDVRDANGNSLGTNNDFATGGQTAELATNNLTPGNAKDSALILNFAPGNYTALVTGNGGVKGVALVEFYNITQN